MESLNINPKIGEVSSIVICGVEYKHKLLGYSPIAKTRGGKVIYTRLWGDLDAPLLVDDKLISEGVK